MKDSRKTNYLGLAPRMQTKPGYCHAGAYQLLYGG